MNINAIESRGRIVGLRPRSRSPVCFHRTRLCDKSLDPCGGCAPNASCLALGGFRFCACNEAEGFVYDGREGCQPDLCATNNGGCNIHARCRNDDGSTSCTCRVGFEGSGRGEDGCLDIDECVGKLNGGCHEDAVCVNVFGSSRCTCPCKENEKCTTVDGSQFCLIDYCVRGG